MSTVRTHAADARSEAVRAAADPERVRELLQAALDRAGHAARVEALGVQRIFYVPGADFTAVYAATLRNGSSAEPVLLFGNIRYEDDAATQVAKAQRKAAKGKFVAPKLGDAAYHLPEVGMVLWTWPNDPRLKTLPAVCDPARARRSLEGLRGPEGAPGEWEIGASDRTLVRYIPRKRAMFRCEIEWRAARGADGAPRAHPSSLLQAVYAKVYDDAENARQAARIQDVLWRVSQSDGRALRVPRPLHLDEDACVLYASAVAGEPLVRQAESIALGRIGEIARALALLQTTRLPVGSAIPLEDELDKLRAAVRLVGSIHPDQGPVLASIETALTTRLPSLPRLPLVPCHGTFKLAHLLDDGHRTSLIDFDSFVLADPVYDVANFTADLCYLEASGALPAGRAERLGCAFHEAWCNQVPWGRRDGVLDWMVVSLLVRKQALKPVKHLHPDAPQKIAHVLRVAAQRLEGRSG